VLVVGQARAEGDKEKLQGEWVSLKRESNGKGEILTRDGPFYHKFKFEGEKVNYTCGKVDDEGTFAIDSSKKPKTIDYTAATGFLMEGIYELDGDTLKICMGGFGSKRPAVFKSKGDMVVFTYERVKAEEKGDKDKKAEDKDKQKLQSEWSLVSLEEDGHSEQVTEDSEDFHKLKVERDKWYVESNKYSGTFAVDSSKKPKTLDLTYKGGEFDGTVVKCFYELYGDTLKICGGNPVYPERPAEFKSRHEVKVWTYKRLKK
jgi:uncharacterized protein (TIGR03067 family)